MARTSMSGRTAVYRIYDATGALLYVGVAKTFGRRWEQHSSSQPWWPHVHRQTVEWFPTRVEAEFAEATAIRDERPLHNVLAGLGPNGLTDSGKTPIRNIRVESRLWDAFGVAVGTRQRSAILRDFIRWFCGETDEMPQRPAATVR